MIEKLTLSTSESLQDLKDIASSANPWSAIFFNPSNHSRRWYYQEQLSWDPSFPTCFKSTLDIIIIPHPSPKCVFLLFLSRT